jgi:ABC-type lipoprotein export system ATPase subunit
VIPSTSLDCTLSNSDVSSNGESGPRRLFEIDDLRVVHKSERKAHFGTVTVLHGLRLSIERGCKLAILGCSGSGKSTVLSILGGLRTSRSCVAISGSVKFFDRENDEHEILDIAHNQEKYRRTHLGFVLPGNSLLPGFTCMQNLCLPLLSLGVKKAVAFEKVRNLVEKYDSVYRTIFGLGHEAYEPLAEHLSKLPDSVSSGQRQRFAVLRSIVHDADVVLADEPFSNLDPLNHDAMLELLSWWQVQSPALRTVILVSHDWARALSWADYVAVFHEGRLVGDKLLEASATSLSDIERMLISKNRQEVFS